MGFAASCGTSSQRHHGLVMSIPSPVICHITSSSPDPLCLEVYNINGIIVSYLELGIFVRLANARTDQVVRGLLGRDGHVGGVVVLLAGTDA